MRANTLGRAALVGGIVAAVAAAMSSQDAQAGQAQGSVTVQATVTSSCNVSTSALNFGAYVSGQASAVTVPNGAGAGNLSISCGGEGGLALSVVLNAGFSTCSTGGVTADHQMKDGANVLCYIIQGANAAGGGTTTFKDATAASTLAATTVAGNNTVINLFGNIPGNQSPAIASGTFTDLLTFNVNY